MNHQLKLTINEKLFKRIALIQKKEQAEGKKKSIQEIIVSILKRRFSSPREIEKSKKENDEEEDIDWQIQEEEKKVPGFWLDDNLIEKEIRDYEEILTLNRAVELQEKKEKTQEGLSAAEEKELEKMEPAIQKMEKEAKEEEARIRQMEKEGVYRGKRKKK